MAEEGILSLSIRKPAYAEVAKPAKLLIKLPDGRIYLAEIRTPARGFESIDTSFTAALNCGFGHEDLFRFLEQLYSLTDYSIADCFRLFEKDMLSFVGRVVLRDTTVLSSHEERTVATEEACIGLREIQRWIRKELPAIYSLRRNFAALNRSISKLLEKHEPALGRLDSPLARRGVRRQLPPKPAKKAWVY